MMTLFVMEEFFSRIRLTELNIPNPVVESGAKGFTVRISDISLKLEARWAYEQKRWYVPSRPTEQSGTNKKTLDCILYTTLKRLEKKSLPIKRGFNAFIYATKR